MKFLFYPMLFFGIFFAFIIARKWYFKYVINPVNDEQQSSGNSQAEEAIATKIRTHYDEVKERQKLCDGAFGSEPSLKFNSLFEHISKN